MTDKSGGAAFPLTQMKKAMRIVTRDVLPTECPWLSQPILEGQTVFVYSGPTYGCIGDGEAVTREYDETPFFELPSDALTARQGETK